jgi:hypothetical protein
MIRKILVALAVAAALLGATAAPAAADGGPTNCTSCHS